MKNNYRAQISLKRENSGFPIWNIPNLMNAVFSVYYKGILLSEIAKEIKNGTNPEDIIVFSNDIDYFKNNTDSISDIIENDCFFQETPLTSENIEFYYKRGEIYSIFPQKEIELIRLFCKVYGMYDKLLRTYKIADQGLKSRKLRSAFKIFTDSGIEASMDYLKDTTQRLFNNKRNKKKILPDILYIHNFFEQEYKSLISKKCIQFDEITNYIKKDDISIKYADDFVYNNYMLFYKYITWNKIPLVGVYSKANNTIKFISNDIFKGSESRYYLDVKNFSHNSPYDLTIIGDPVIISILASLLYDFLIKTHIDNLKEKRKIKRFEEHFLSLIDASMLSADDKDAFMEYYNNIRPLDYIREKINDLNPFFLKNNLLKCYSDILFDFQISINNLGFNVNMDNGIKIYKDLK